MPAEVFPVGAYISDELEARQITTRDVARLGEAEDVEVTTLALEMLVYAPTKGVRLDTETATVLGRAFDTSPEFWLNLDEAWQGSPRR